MPRFRSGHFVLYNILLLLNILHIKTNFVQMKQKRNEILYKVFVVISVGITSGFLIFGLCRIVIHFI